MTTQAAKRALILRTGVRAIESTNTKIFSLAECRRGFYANLARAGFDVTAVREIVRERRLSPGHRRDRVAALAKVRKIVK